MTGRTRETELFFQYILKALVALVFARVCPVFTLGAGHALRPGLGWGGESVRLLKAVKGVALIPKRSGALPPSAHGMHRLRGAVGRRLVLPAEDGEDGALARQLAVGHLVGERLARGHAHLAGRHLLHPIGRLLADGRLLGDRHQLRLGGGRPAARPVGKCTVLFLSTGAPGIRLLRTLRLAQVVRRRVPEVQRRLGPRAVGAGGAVLPRGRGRRRRHGVQEGFEPLLLNSAVLGAQGHDVRAQQHLEDVLVLLVGAGPHARGQPHVERAAARRQAGVLLLGLVVEQQAPLQHEPVALPHAHHAHLSPLLQVALHLDGRLVHPRGGGGRRAELRGGGRRHRGGGGGGGRGGRVGGAGCLLRDLAGLHRRPRLARGRPPRGC